MKNVRLTMPAPDAKFLAERASTDETRAHLGYVEFRGPYATATDGQALLRLRVHKISNGNPLAELPAGLQLLIQRDLLLAAIKAASNKGELEIAWDGAAITIYALNPKLPQPQQIATTAPVDVRFPAVEQIIPTELNAEKPTGELCFNPALLGEVTAAVQACRGSGVVLHVPTDEASAMAVTAVGMGPEERLGLIMPMRP